MVRASSKRGKCLAFLTVGLLLFAQFASAAQGCMLARAPAGPATAEQMAAEGCDGAPMDAAACLARCLEADQSAASHDDNLQFVLPSAFTSATDFVVPRVWVSQSATVLHLPAGPPLRVLFCSYQT